MVTFLRRSASKFSKSTTHCSVLMVEPSLTAIKRLLRKERTQPRTSTALWVGSDFNSWSIVLSNIDIDLNAKDTFKKNSKKVKSYRFRDRNEWQNRSPRPFVMIRWQ